MTHSSLKLRARLKRLKVIFYAMAVPLLIIGGVLLCPYGSGTEEAGTSIPGFITLMAGLMFALYGYMCEVALGIEEVPARAFIKTAWLYILGTFLSIVLAVLCFVLSLSPERIGTRPNYIGIAGLIFYVLTFVFSWKTLALFEKHTRDYGKIWDSIKTRFYLVFGYLKSWFRGEED